jgi:hypothetical protein
VMMLVQKRKSLQQPLAHVGRDGGWSLGSAEQLGALEVHRNELGESAAEIDEDREGRH